MTRLLLSAAARAVLGGGPGPDRLRSNSSLATSPSTGAHSFRRLVATIPDAERGQPPDGLSFWNGFGGFTPDGHEYVIVIDSHLTCADRHCLRLPGRMCSPIPSSDVWSRTLGLGYSWAGQQSDESPDSVVQRSDFGSARRSDLFCVTRRPATSGRQHRCRSGLEQL
jgi:hypothetical protein